MDVGAKRPEFDLNKARIIFIEVNFTSTLNSRRDITLIDASAAGGHKIGRFQRRSFL